MPKYRGHVTIYKYRAFEFEADDEELAWDHIDYLTSLAGTDRMLDKWEETGPDGYNVEDVVEL